MNDTADATAGQAPAAQEQTPERTWKLTHTTPELHRTNKAWYARSSYVPGFTKKGGSHECPSCGFVAFGFSEKCSKCGEPLQK